MSNMHQNMHQICPWFTTKYGKRPCLRNAILHRSHYWLPFASPLKVRLQHSCRLLFCLRSAHFNGRVSKLKDTCSWSLCAISWNNFMWDISQLTWKGHELKWQPNGCMYYKSVPLGAISYSYWTRYAQYPCFKSKTIKCIWSFCRWISTCYRLKAGWTKR